MSTEEHSTGGIWTAWAFGVIIGACAHSLFKKWRASWRSAKQQQQYYHDSCDLDLEAVKMNRGCGFDAARSGKSSNSFSAEMEDAASAIATATTPMKRKIPLANSKTYYSQTCEDSG
ncbi:hypothetical protein NUU61_002865 [Penicillium alfredii]|uniref:Uncharacterized protein n=1 Tax=Penicillium alfredii TaxID=1506179 RepID=A0A9W9FSF1_9EURO|nr:uncharacterized protein NUU61_002865 [Penicillium alfredii]KAJ5105518.1 hypothetical protein NUU61_002865 [Penicillium alfredii]